MAHAFAAIVGNKVVGMGLGTAMSLITYDSGITVYYKSHAVPGWPYAKAVPSDDELVVSTPMRFEDLPTKLKTFLLLFPDFLE